MWLAICTLVLLYLWYRQRKRPAYPMPPELAGKLPLIGHAHKMMGNITKIFNFVEYLTEECLKNDGVMVLSLGPRTIYAVTDPYDCITISNECLKKGFIFDFAKSWLGEGLFTSEGEIWRNHRRTLAPAFNRSTLIAYMDVFNIQARKLAETLKSEVGNGPFDQEKYVALSNLEVICLTALGIDASDQKPVFKEYIKSLQEILGVIYRRLQQFWLHNDYIYEWSNVKKIEDKAIATMRNLTNSIIEKRKLKIQQSDDLNQSSDIEPFLDFLLKLPPDNSVYTEQHIVNEIDSIIFGGHDTTSITLTFLLLLLGSYEDVQEKVYEEITNIFGDTDRDVDKDDLTNLEYLDAVIKEALRLYPVLPIAPRKATSDVKLRNYTIPEGSTIFMLTRGAQRHSIWGDDAYKFRPERWLDKNSLPENPNVYSAFGIGKRSCIGKTFAMMSMKTTLVHLVRRYRISGDITKLQLKIESLLKPHSGYQISIKERC